jgi:hypothetical protein
MFCLSCGKKIPKNSKFCKYCGANQIETVKKEKKKINKKEYEVVWTCDFCGKEFKTKKESDKHELSCIQNPNKLFYKNNSQKTWFFLWVTTLLVFAVNCFIFSKYHESGITSMNNNYLKGMFFFNILIGVFAFLAMITNSFKKKNKTSFLIKNIFTICLVYFLIVSITFASEGDKLKKNQEYKNSLISLPTPILLITSPTPTLKITKKSVNSNTKVVDSDPVIDCKSSSPNCNGSSIRVRQSQCSKITCCEIGNYWSLYPTTEKCREVQDKYWSDYYNNRNIIPTSTYKTPTQQPTPTTVSITPTQQPTPNINLDEYNAAKEGARIDKCKGDCARWAFEQTTSARVKCSVVRYNYCNDLKSYQKSLVTECLSECI